MHRNQYFTSELAQMLKNQMEIILKTEVMLTEADNSSVKQIMETKKMHSLEKLSDIELQAIKEDLLIQRDLMSKRLSQRTSKNRKLEWERENVHNAIQEEGKTLIKKCNSLRREGITLAYKIGLVKKDAEELTSEIKKNFPNKGVFMKNNKASKVNSSQKFTIKKKKELPLDTYKRQNEMAKPQKLGISELGLPSNIEPQSSQALLQYLMKQASNIYQVQDKNDDENYDDYQVSIAFFDSQKNIHNFVGMDN